MTEAENEERQAPSGWTLPLGYRWIRTLADRRGVCVVLAEHEEKTVALRLERAGRPRESLSELDVLATVRHPGLAQLVDHGLLPGGEGLFLAREWIEGRALSDLRGELAPERAGKLVADLCRALEHLHEHGFVHADLKSGNVIVRPDGTCVLTDFGFAVRDEASGAGAVASGTPISIAPELLVGGSPDPRCDLFSLGVLLCDLLIPIRVSAQEFYGRFPSESFFDAIRARTSDLPEWARDIVERLVEPDPARRPPSAAFVAHLLEGRLGIKRPGKMLAARVELRWPLLRGKEAFLESELVPDRAAGHAARWWSLATGEDPAALVDAISLRLSLRGRRVHKLFLERSLERIGDSRALDRWVRAALLQARGGALLVSTTRSESWTCRALDCLARSWSQIRDRRADETPFRLVAIGCGPAPSERWENADVPLVQEAEILGFLREELQDPEDERLELLAARLHAECRGRLVPLQLLLDELANNGWLRWTRERPSLRAGALPSWIGRARSAITDASRARLDRSEQLLLGALELSEGCAALARLARVLSLSERELAGPLERLREHAFVEMRRGEAGRIEVSLPRTRPARNWIALSEDDWKELAASEARMLAEEGADARRRLPILYRADPSQQVVSAIEEAVVELLDERSAELALDLLLRVSETARVTGRSLEPALVARLALAHVAAGEVVRASELLDGLEAIADRRVRALVALVRGTIAGAAQDHERELTEYERALALGAEDRGEILLAKARLLLEMGEHEALDALFEGLDAERESTLAPSVRINLRSIRAMEAFRRGDVASARSTLESALAETRSGSDYQREAAVRINLGTIDRRAGRLEDAERHFEIAEALYERTGVLPGMARARTLRGGLLREKGELHEASELLLSALEMRERLGDETGAAAVRGTLGMLWLERGHLHAAIEELEAGARKLESGSRAADGRLLRALAREARARIGRPSTIEVAEALSEQDDPRIDLAAGRALWMTGRPERAASAFARARDRAKALRRVAIEEEASFLLHLVEGRTASAPQQAETARDARLLALLGSSGETLDEAAVRTHADELARRGRNDRAARLLLALAARGVDPAQRREDARRAAEQIDACAAGLSREERAELRKHLLSVPDPLPADLETITDPISEDMDLDVLAVLDINHRLVEQKDLATLLGQIVESALALTGAERGFLVLEDDGELVLDLALDSRRGDIDEPEVEFSRTIVRRALAERRVLRLSNASDDPLVSEAPSVVQLDLRSIVCHPFDVQAGLRGVIYLDHRLRTGAFTERAERLLALLADQAALAIRQMRQIEEIRRLNAELGRQVVAKDSDLRAARRALLRAGLEPPVGGLVGDSPAMRRVQDLLRRLGPSELPVLVCGPSGTGKELAARALHDLSPRKDRLFVSESCAALPPSLIESELFGHQKGAFTGAERDREGLFERASGGTLFLDEIGELPLELQAKLLRVFETREVRRIGATESRKVDFRLLAATNRDLAKEVEEGRFRSDLYYRLDAVRVEMPPLSERSEDIPALVDHFMRLEATRSGRKQTLAPAVLERLCRRTWPGNVRELANEVARLCVLSPGDVDDPDLVREPRETSQRAGGSSPVATLADLERQAILDALERTGGDKSAAADLLGISRAKIYQRLKEWRESDERKASSGPM